LETNTVVRPVKKIWRSQPSGRLPWSDRRARHAGARQARRLPRAGGRPCGVHLRPAPDRARGPGRAGGLATV